MLTQEFVISHLPYLPQGFLAGGLKVPALGIFDFYDDPYVLLFYYGYDIAVAFAGLPVGGDCPAFLKAEEAQQDAVVEVLFEAVPDGIVMDADGFP